MVDGGHLGFPSCLRVKPINVNISASKSLRRSKLVSKFTFSGSMNAVKMLGISVSDVLPTVDDFFGMIFTQLGKLVDNYLSYNGHIVISY